LFAVPSGESPDEPSHLRCIEQVSLENRLPEVDPKPTGQWWERTTTVSGYLCHHLPLYYLTAGAVQKVVHGISGAPLHFELPPNHPGWVSASPSMFLHTNKTSFLTIPEPLTVVALRIMSILLGLVTVWAAYRSASAVIPNDPTLPIIAATLCAGWPQFLYLQRAINNDVLATALASGVLLTLLNIGRPRRLILATGLACLAILAKLTMAFTLAVVALAYGLEWFNFRAQRRTYLISGLMSLGLVSLLAALLIFQPTINNHLLADQRGFGSILPQASTLTYWFDVLKWSISSGFARFGWMNVPAPEWQSYAWWALIAVATLIGLGSVLKAPHDQRQKLLLIILFIWATGTLAIYLRLNSNRFQPQFRYAFPLLPIITLLFATGYRYFWNRTGWSSIASVSILVVGLISVNLYLIFFVIGPTYAGALP
jgi:hypothetical protein